VITVPRGFEEMLSIDFEFSQPAGCVPRVVCVSAHEIVSGRKFRLMLDQDPLPIPPWRTDKRCLVFGYALVAEMSCYLSLGWEMPHFLLDLFFEFRWITNDFVDHRGLLDACEYFNAAVPPDRRLEKKAMRELAIHWFEKQRTGEERTAILKYNDEDTDDNIVLLDRMQHRIDFGRAITFRGQYAKDVAQMERAGIPIDVGSRNTIVARKTEMEVKLIGAKLNQYPVYELLKSGQYKFDFGMFEQFLAAHHISWPRTESGRLETKKETFETMCKAHPLMGDLYELRSAITQVRSARDVPRIVNGREIRFLSVGSDNIGRSPLKPLSTLSGRNAPSTTDFSFNLATCLRSLIDPRCMPGYERDGYGLAYLDYGQQEFAIQAQRSSDPMMIAAYQSGDPYTFYPQQAGYTFDQAKNQRDQFKRATLGIGYGMGVDTLGYYVGVDYGRADELMEVHQRVFKRYWQWQEDCVMEHWRQVVPMTVPYDGWQFSTAGAKKGTCYNFFMQGGGATMLRAAIRQVHSAGITIHAPVHDALLIGAPVRDLNDAVATAMRLMSDAGERCLEGVLRPRVDKKLIVNERYHDKRGAKMWRSICDVLGLVD
jgi:DNA polymerase-1